MKIMLPLCMLGLSLGCEEPGEDPVEVGEDLGELEPVEETPDGTRQDAQPDE